MTKLDAVNEILLKTGNLPVAQLDTNGGSRAGIVERVLDSEEFKIQMDAWHYNHRISLLSPDATTSRITVPTGTLFIDSYGRDACVNVTQIGDVLYNEDDNTYEFTDDLECEYWLRIDYPCIPPPVREFIACSAAAAYNRQFGSRSRQDDLNNEVLKARVRALRFNQSVGDSNFLHTQEAMRFKGDRTRLTPTRVPWVNT